MSGVLSATLGSYGAITNYTGTGFVSIASVTATGGESSLSLSSIASTYSNLHIRGIAKTSWTTVDNPSTLQIQFNGDTTASYYGSNFTYTGSAVGAASNSGTALYAGYMANGVRAGEFSGHMINIHDYANSSYKKSVNFYNGWSGDTSTTTAWNAMLGGGYWNGTAAIASITFSSTTGTFVAGTKFSLYGLKAS